MTTDPYAWCGCGTAIGSETGAQRHAKTCPLMGWPKRIAEEARAEREARDA